MTELSVVIPVYDNWWLTQRCLRELERLGHGGTIAFETIVVDNASRDETPQAIAAFPWVRYLRHDTNRNFAGACNAGARLAKAPLTFFLNNDAYPLGDALTPLVRAFERPDVAIAGGALFFEDGATQSAGLVLLPNAHWHYYCRNLPAAEVERDRDALAVSGAAMAVRTDWFVESGGFDESFRNGFEDVDLCMRARRQGHAIAFVANSRFAHYEAASAGRFDREDENERHFYSRWVSELSHLPRTARGTVGAIELRGSSASSSLLQAACDDLAAALRAFGHPVVRGRIAPWQRLDRRFRHGAALEWFSRESRARGIAVALRNGGATIRTRGAVTLEVPWLPCASSERVQCLRLRRSDAASCRTIGIAGGNAREAALPRDLRVVSITPQMLLGDVAAELACVVHLGLTDEAAFGNVLLAQAGLPSVVSATAALQRIFADDVALVCAPHAISEAVSRFVVNPALRVRYGELVAADARRRFSPRRSAIRVVDLLCASRFGLERPGVARSDRPR